MLLRCIIPEVAQSAGTSMSALPPLSGDERKLPQLTRIPVKLMQVRAADSVALSPRLLRRGEGGDEGPITSILVFAPHPTPLPVKNGEREQTDTAASSDPI